MTVKWAGLERFSKEVFDAVHDQHESGVTLDEVVRRALEPLLEAAEATVKFRGKLHKDCGEKCDLNNLRKEIDTWRKR